MTIQEGVSVYVRVRPLTQAERDEGCTHLDGLALESSTPSPPPEEEGCSSSGTAVALGPSTTNPGRPAIGGFAGVLGQSSTNRDVFERSFESRLPPSVLRGGTASLFCYGYTGGGKTHTAIGYGKEERGLFFLAAEKLLRDLNAESPQSAPTEEDASTNTTNNADSEHADDGAMFLSATACEIYNDEVFDLLGEEEEKVKCTLRTDHRGQLTIQGPSVTEQMEGVRAGGGNNEEGGSPSEHATLVTKSGGLRSIPVRKTDDLDAIHQTCVDKRACGTSTANAQSSRSHAILRLEVVSPQVQQLRNAVQLLEVQVPALKNAVDNAMTASHTILYSGCRRVLRAAVEGEDGDDRRPVSAKEGDWEVESITVEGLIALKDVGEGGVVRSLEDWAQCLDVREGATLKMKYVQVLREYPGGAEERDARAAENDAELESSRRLLARKEADLTEAAARLDEALANGAAALGGSMLLVDLAGADYDHRANAAQKESAAINKSLLTLKECFRSLSGESSKRPPFRNSKLTRILQGALAPTKASSGKRNKGDNVSVMLVNVSPAAELEKGTVNALRYGQMYAVGGGGGRCSSNRKEAAAGRGKSSKSRMSKVREEALRTALRTMYKKNAPEMSEAEVEDVLEKNRGREAGLLKKLKSDEENNPSLIL